MSDAGAHELVRWDRDGPVLVLTIDHPPVNVLSSEVLDRIVERLAEAERDPEVRAIVLDSAAEKTFAAGADIRAMSTMGPDEARVHGARGQATTRAIERVPVPVIAAVHGVCFGGGCELALACDFVVASDDARFGQPEINLGIAPGWGGTQRLPRIIGAARARRWIMTGAGVTAQEAHGDGLVDQVVPRTELRAAALRLAHELAGKPPLALAATKYAIQAAVDPRIDEGLAYELDLWARLFGGEEQREGMRAFLEKRAARFGGRAAWSVRSAGFPWSDEVRKEVKRPRSGRN